jgi:hypothetical protein
MPDAAHPDMRIAASPHLLPVIATTGFCGLLSAGAIAAHATRPTPALDVPVIPIVGEESVRLIAATTAKQATPPPAPSKELLFVFRAAGETWVKLSDDEPRHGKRKLVEDEDATATVAEVAVANLPAALRSWVGETVAVDGICRAHVTGFAVVTRLVGDPGYAGLDDQKWTVRTAAEAGKSVLAARIDACAKGTFARRASLAPIVIPETIEDAKLADAARAAFLASQAAQDAQTAWSENANDAWSEHATLTTRILRHPTTGTRWVAIHAGGEHECGGADFNVWGLFRVGADGTLFPAVTRKLETIYDVDHIIDVDNDGTFELVGRDWLGLSTVYGAVNGDEIDRLEMPFHGCPC